MVFNPVNELKIGKISEVNGTSIKVELDPQIVSLTKTYKGKVISIGQMASIIKIHYGRSILFATVSMLKMKNELTVTDTGISIDKDARIMEAELIGQGDYNISSKMLKFDRGVSKYPLPTQDVYLMTEQEISLLYQGVETNTENGDNLLVIGKYAGTRQDCRADINKLFGHHCAVLGSTGTGKSGTVSAIIHGLMEKNEHGLTPRIIMIDPHGEYKNNFKEFGTTYKVYEEQDDETQKLKLPYWLMTSDEFRSLVIGKTEYEATKQNNIVYEALRYARLVSKGLIQRFDKDAMGEAKLIYSDNINEDDILKFDRDKPVPFKLADFVFHIDKVQGQKKDTLSKLAVSAGRDKIEDVLKKLRILQSNPQLKFIFEEYDESLGKQNVFSIINQLVGNHDGNKKSLKIVDISGFPNEVSGVLTALISRILFQYKLWQSVEDRKKDPIVLVYEEAHRYVPNSGEAQYKEAQIAVRRIAKEGRKYGIGLMLISQRPADLEKTVLSQCGSWIIMRLTNATDQSYVANFLPDNLSGLTKILPSLSNREAVFVGEASLIPSRIKIRKLPKEKLPDSSDIDFISGWKNELPGVEEIKLTIGRWLD